VPLDLGLAITGWTRASRSSIIQSHRVAKEGEMAEVLLFHHAQGQTAGFHAFAD
jgi:hypothetical protein